MAAKPELRPLPPKHTNSLRSLSSAAFLASLKSSGLGKRSRPVIVPSGFGSALKKDQMREVRRQALPVRALVAPLRAGSRPPRSRRGPRRLSRPARAGGARGGASLSSASMA